jgi:hypothetical protein
VWSELRVKQPSPGYRVELDRDGEPYVTFLDGLSRQNAEREARSLTPLWIKIGALNSGGRAPARAAKVKTEI